MSRIPVVKRMHKLLQTLYGKDDISTLVTDALADLRHMCDAHGLDFHNCGRIAYSHYVTESEAMALLRRQNAVKELEILLEEAKRKLHEKIDEQLSVHAGANGENQDVLSASCLYVSPIRADLHIFTVEEFRESCKNKSLIEADGWGHPAKANKQDRSIRIVPSKLDRIPSDATHIVWYNR